MLLRTPTKPLVVVLNGRASGLPPRDVVARALEAAGGEPDVIVTESPGDLASAWEDQRDRRLVLVGGDGTVHAAANLLGAPREIALIPAGRANNIARSVGIPLDLECAARLAVTGAARPIDLIEATTPHGRHVVVEGISAGFLAQARSRYHGRNSADLGAAIRAGARALTRFKSLDVHVGGEHLTLAQLFVANLPLYAFGLRVAPHADPTDATLDLVGIEADTRRAVLRMLLDLHRGTALDAAATHLYRARTVTLTTDGCTPIIGDSTDLGAGPVELAPLPGALSLVRP